MHRVTKKSVSSPRVRIETLREGHTSSVSHTVTATSA
jgi:hypothetical protein